MKILLVDDDELTVTNLSCMLISIGYNVVMAKDGVELLEKLDDTIDLIITDITMPNLNGYAAIEIAKYHFNSNIPVIAITANSKDTLKANTPFNTIFYKPVIIADLVESINDTKRV